MAGRVQAGLAAAPAQVCSVRGVGAGDPGNRNAVESEAKKGRMPTLVPWAEQCRPSAHVYPEPQNVPLFGSKVFAE